ncbi:DUF397 domain-containing protein [Amycolatopsis palatopharyngis]|uniref:DUF397 domain-containing protein n=1 Tax=Amycolatopsis palatopharyngis TaxID=187982 RepID=UPI000E272F6A|nr:DUF397 domain-containing protein [Amycolatopsis palatopharyngis]
MGDNTVKIPHSTDTWRKSSYSGGQSQCVEVAHGQSIGVRDTKDREGGHLVLPSAGWRAFTDQVKRG